MVLIVIAGAGLLYFLNNNRSSGFSTQVNQTANDQTEPLSGTINVAIKNFSFEENIVKIKKGSKIIWTNQDSTAHTVTSDEGDTLNSELLAKGESYEQTFNEPGTFRYHCTPHPQMLGAVVVVE